MDARTLTNEWTYIQMTILLRKTPKLPDGNIIIIAAIINKSDYDDGFYYRDNLLV